MINFQNLDFADTSREAAKHLRASIWLAIKSFDEGWAVSVHIEQPVIGKPLSESVAGALSYLDHKYVLPSYFETEAEAREAGLEYALKHVEDPAWDADVRAIARK